MIRTSAPSRWPFRRRSGITLTEILISIFILGIGLISLATLFPIGLLKLRDAQRQSRSAYLVESAAPDAETRGLFTRESFGFADLLNAQFGLAVWYPAQPNLALPNGFNPLVQDTGWYGVNAYGPYVPFNASSPNVIQGVTSANGEGVPFAYDPLWRFQTNRDPNDPLTRPGTYLYAPDPTGTYPNGIMPEARFASGIGSMRPDQVTGSIPPSAHGLQRLTNFNGQTVTVNGNLVPAMPETNSVPRIFVSPEDIVWQDPNNTDSTYTLNGAFGGVTVLNPSAIVPDLNTGGGSTINEWRYTWLITAKQNNSATASTFDGNIVVMENRPFAIDMVGTNVQVAGERVVEAVFGYSKNVVTAAGYSRGYGAGADRTVLLRWPNTQPDPTVKVGDWIADVTYERSQFRVVRRFFRNDDFSDGYPNPMNNMHWDNLPAQRCFWYQVQKVSPAAADGQVANNRSMIVYVDRKLEARTLLDAASGLPPSQNAALVSPHVVNVIPQTFFVR